MVFVYVVLCGSLTLKSDSLLPQETRHPPAMQRATLLLRHGRVCVCVCVFGGRENLRKAFVNLYSASDCCGEGLSASVLSRLCVYLKIVPHLCTSKQVVQMELFH